MPTQLGTRPPRTPRSPWSPLSPLGFQHRGTCTVTFKFSQTMVFLLGLTYIGIMLLSPMTRTSSSHLSLLSLEGWNLPVAKPTAEAFKMETSSSKACQYPSNSSLSSLSKNVLPSPNRTIALIHVGKAGGVSLRRMTVIFCKLFFIRKTNYTREMIALKTQRCIDKKFPDPKAVLAHQTKNYCHIESYDDTELAASTSFLVTLRNPVDRIISTYRYSHPGNCNSGNRDEVWRPRGCEAEKHRDEKGLIQNTILFECFPSPAMEDFAQALLRPWNRGNFDPSLSKQQRRHCRYLAREMVQGYGTKGSAPHMLYNYAYYTQLSVWRYPSKEVFGVRTEHEMEDIRALDKLLGGNGNLGENTEVSHGSEGYAPSPLTAVAYQKLCCVLEMELGIYEDLLARVVNLDWASKLQEMNNLRDKCGVTTSWTQWRLECQNKLRTDLRILKPSLVVNETEAVLLSNGTIPKRRKRDKRQQQGETQESQQEDQI